MKTIVAVASITLVAIVLGMSTTSLAMAQSEPACMVNDSIVFSWVLTPTTDEDNDRNANGFVCVLNYNGNIIPRITIDDL